jgi:hypothetical protein
VLVKRTVLEDIGCFDESLKTAEDLDLHLRIASKYKIGLICDPLFNAMSGHESLSSLPRTYDDHVFVLERFADAYRTAIDSKLMKKALFKTFIEAANGKFRLKEWQYGVHYTLRAFKYAATLDQVFTLGKMWAKCFKYFIKRYCQKI